MSQVYTPTATSHGSFVLPSDGDPAVAESVNDALRDLADNALVALTNAASALTLAGQAVNGTTGGTYAPAAVITIGGAGLTVSGAFTATGTAVLRGSSIQLGDASSDTLNVLATSIFAGPTTVSGALTVTGTFTAASLTLSGDLAVDGSVTLGSSGSDTVMVNAPANFLNAVTFENTTLFDAAMVVDAPATFNSDVTLGNAPTDVIAIGGRLQISRRLTYTSTGRVPYRTPVMLPDSGATVSVADGDVFVIKSNTTGNWTYSVSTSGAVSGDRILFLAGSPSAPLDTQITISAGNGSAVFPAASGGGMEIIYVADRTDGLPDGWFLLSYTAI